MVLGKGMIEFSSSLSSRGLPSIVCSQEDVDALMGAFQTLGSSWVHSGWFVELSDLDALADAWVHIVDLLSVTLYEEWEDDTRIAVSNVKNRLTYARLDTNGPKLDKISKTNPLVESYFMRCGPSPNSDPLGGLKKRMALWLMVIMSPGFKRVFAFCYHCTTQNRHQTFHCNNATPTHECCPQLCLSAPTPANITRAPRLQCWSYSSFTDSDIVGSPRHLTVSTQGNVPAERFSSPSFQFAMQVTIYADDLPEDMVFDPLTEAIVFKHTLRDRDRLQSQSSSLASPGLPMNMCRKVFVFPKNVAVAEVIEIGLEQFGILEGVVDGGDEIEDKSTKRRSSSRVRYGLAVDAGGQELPLSSKVIDVYSRPPIYKALLGTVDDVSSSDPIFILQQATSYRNFTSCHCMSAPLDKLALQLLSPPTIQERIMQQKDKPQSQQPTPKEIIAAQRRAKQEKQCDILLSTQTNLVRGVDLLLPGNLHTVDTCPVSLTYKLSPSNPDPDPPASPEPFSTCLKNLQPLRPVLSPSLSGPFSQPLFSPPSSPRPLTQSSPLHYESGFPDFCNGDQEGPLVMPFINAAEVVGQGRTYLDDFNDNHFSKERETNLYYPFASRAEWETASFLLNSSLTMAEIDSYLKLELTKNNKLSFATAQKLQERVELLLPVPEWKFRLTNFSSLSQQNTSHLIVSGSAGMFAGYTKSPLIYDSLNLTPLEIFTSSAKLVRVYESWLSGKRANEMQKELPKGATLLGTVLSSNKTTISVITGNCVAHPLLISLANIDTELRSKASQHLFNLLALIPIPKFIEKKKSVQSILENCLYHLCLDIVLQPLRIAALIGCLMDDPVGQTRFCYTLCASFIVDMPEASLISCVGGGGKTSPFTKAIYKDYGDSKRHPPRLAKSNLGAH
ncbi:hypothetical protein BT96DRAFT_1000839 [Gymnopus androsaceus JB14]|uniref:Glycogen debranching enzyme glucanotransferase domain-containing protein n=1 Tax=Gymnopus androsaceus JB14 TaxID=1447944 RepID=A0A6A4H468_9AGAR|nr:hypothetical protein BT96DRAFT_1000839 [Gymnopus androsaceus JB14]